MLNEFKEYEEILNKFQTSLRSIGENQLNKNQLFRIIISFLKDNLDASAAILENHVPGSTPSLYTEIEAIAKENRTMEISKMTKLIDYSCISNINDNDEKSARLYITNQLAVALANATLEIPKSFQTVASMLTAIQLLLCNVLVQKVPYVAALSFMDDLYKNIHHVLEKETPQHKKEDLTRVKQ